MATKQKATVQVRIYPKTHKRLKIKAAKCQISLAETVDMLSVHEVYSYEQMVDTKVV